MDDTLCPFWGGGGFWSACVRIYFHFPLVRCVGPLPIPVSPPPSTPLPSPRNFKLIKKMMTILGAAEARLTTSFFFFPPTARSFGASVLNTALIPTFCSVLFRCVCVWQGKAKQGRARLPIWARIEKTLKEKKRGNLVIILYRVLGSFLPWVLLAAWRVKPREKGGKGRGRETNYAALRCVALPRLGRFD